MQLANNPPPNETTTPVLNPRGPRRAALGSGPWGEWPCVFQLSGLSTVTPTKKQTVSKDKIFLNLDKFN